MIDASLERARAGDRAALEALLAAVAPAVQRFGRRMCGNDADADDVLQDTLVEIAQHLGAFEGRASFASWAFAIARSACSRRRRGLKNQPPLPDDAVAERADEAPSPEAAASEQELARVLERALAALSDEQREVLLLRDIEGLTAPEAADALGLSIDALKSRLHRARAALRQALRPVLEPAVVAAPGPGACPDVARLWSQKLEDDLSAVDCAAMEQHIAACPACAAACDALKRALVACRSARTEAVPPAVQARVKRALRALTTE